MCHLTDHAVQRTKERVGLPKRSAEKNAQKALENGIRHCETKGSLNRYITALYWKHKALFRKLSTQTAGNRKCERRSIC